MRRSDERRGNGSDEERFSKFGRRGSYGESQEDDSRWGSGRGSEPEGSYGGESDSERERWESGTGSGSDGWQGRQERSGGSRSFGGGSFGGGGSSGGGSSFGGRSSSSGYGRGERSGYGGFGESSGSQRSESWGGGRGSSDHASSQWQGDSAYRRGQRFGRETAGGYGHEPSTWTGERFTSGEDRGGERWGRSGMEWSGGYGSGSTRSGGGQESQRRRRMPKGYTRSDERIREDVCDRLSEADVECEDVTVVVQSGVVTLSGHAPSGDTRREIERIAEGVSGVKDVTNQIHTGRQRDEDGGESRKSTSTSSSSYMGSSSGKRDSSKTS